jgi:hypothetical protein
MDDKNWSAFLHGSLIGILAGIGITLLTLIFFS